MRKKSTFKLDSMPIARDSRMKQRPPRVHLSIPHLSSPIMKSPKKVYLPTKSLVELLSILNL
jgi:hypothetical protein